MLYLQHSISEGVTTPPSPEALEKENILKNWPSLKKIANQVSLDQLRERATLVAELTDIKKSPMKRLGIFDNNTQTIDSINTIINLIENEKDVAKIGETEINSSVGGRIIFSQKQTVRVFLGRVLNNAKLVSGFFSESITRSPKDPETEKRISRLDRFLVAFETRNSDKTYKPFLNEAHKALAKGEVETAQGKVRNIFEKHNLEVGYITNSEEGLMKGLRAISAREEAGKVAMEGQKEDLKKRNLTDAQKSLTTYLQSHLDKNGDNVTRLANKQYDQVLASLPEGHPKKYELIQNKDVILQSFRNDIAYMQSFRSYIQKNGSDNLGIYAEVYNDMEGLYGHMSDATYHMTKEAAIMLASFAVTGGVGPLLGVIGVGARGLQAGAAIQATKLATEGEKIHRAAMASKTATGLGNIAKGADALKVAQASKLVSLPTSAIVFTTTDAMVRSLWRETGEISGFDNFLNKLARNTLMFTAFSGMEASIGKFLLPKNIALSSGFTVQHAGKILAFTGGDVAVMQTLHLAETGKIEWDTNSIIQALAFRMGMKAGGTLPPLLKEYFPNLTQRLQWKKNTNKPVREEPAGTISKEVPKLETPNPSKQTYTTLSPNDRGQIFLNDAIKNELGKITGIKIGKNKEGDFIQGPDGERVSLSGTTGISVDTNHGIIYLQKPHGSSAYQIDATRKFKITEFGISPETTLPPTPSHVAPERGNESTPTKGLLGHQENMNHTTGHTDKRITPADAMPDGSVRNPFSYHTDVSDAVYVSKPKRGAKKENPTDTPVVQYSERGTTIETPISHEFATQRYTYRISLDAQGKGVIEVKTIGDSDFRPFKPTDIDMPPAHFQARVEREIQLLQSQGNRKTGDGGASTKTVDIIIDTKSAIKIPTQQQLRNLMQGMKPGDVVSLEIAGLPGWKITKLPQGDARANNVFELSIPGKDPIRVEGAGELQKRIQEEARKFQVPGASNTPDDGSSSSFITVNPSHERGMMDIPMGKSGDKMIIDGREFRYSEKQGGWVRGNGDGTFQIIRPTSGVEPSARQNGTIGGVENTPLRIENKGSKRQESAEIFSSQSFRKEMEHLMALDDATFQKQFTELQERGVGRPYEKEIYEAAARIRRMSNSQIINGADHPMENRVGMGKKGISPSEKAHTIAENAALRARLKNILSEQHGVSPGQSEALLDAARTGNREAFMKGFDKKWLTIPAILVAIYLLAQCDGDNSKDVYKKPITTVVPTEATIESVYNICRSCYTGPKSNIDSTRRINGHLANDAYREGVSRRWMNTKEWKNMIREYKTNISMFPKESAIVLAMDSILNQNGGATVANVQKLQHCIRMLDASNTSSDSKESQDGMLGPITTKALLAWINDCKKKEEK